MLKRTCVHGYTKADSRRDRAAFENQLAEMNARQPTFARFAGPKRQELNRFKKRSGAREMARRRNQHKA